MKCPFQERDFARPFVHPSIDACRPEVGQQADTEGKDARGGRHLARQRRRRRTVIEDSSLASLNPSREDAVPNLP